MVSISYTITITHRESLTNKKDSQSEIVRIISYAF